MSERWTPPLHVREVAGRCRLCLGGFAYGDGPTLQDAADDLVARLGELAVAFRAGGLRISTELGPPDHRWLDFVWELGELASRGEDIRPRVLS